MLPVLGLVGTVIAIRNDVIAFYPVSVQRGARSPPSPTVASEFARNGMGRVQARVDTRSLASERADACR